MKDEERAARIEEAKRRADECSDRVVASHHFCSGCYGDAYCNISQKWDEAYPDNLLKRLFEDPIFRSNVTIFRLN